MPHKTYPTIDEAINNKQNISYHNIPYNEYFVYIFAKRYITNFVELPDEFLIVKTLSGEYICLVIVDNYGIALLNIFNYCKKNCFENKLSSSGMFSLHTFWNYV